METRINLFFCFRNEYVGPAQATTAGHNSDKKCEFAEIFFFAFAPVIQHRVNQKSQDFLLFVVVCVRMVSFDPLKAPIFIRAIRVNRL